MLSFMLVLLYILLRPKAICNHIFMGKDDFKNSVLVSPPWDFFSLIRWYWNVIWYRCNNIYKGGGISYKDNIDGLVQDCSNSSALAVELLQSCTESSISYLFRNSYYKNKTVLWLSYSYDGNLHTRKDVFIRPGLLRNFNVKSMRFDKNFQTWLLIVCQYNFQSNRSQVWTFLLTDMDFNMEISPWCTLLDVSKLC